VHGTGFVVADDLVLTSAHTLRGARSVTVTRSGRTVAAAVVGFDPDNDLAYLRAPLGAVRPVSIDRDVADDGDRGTAWAVRGHDIVAIGVTVVRSVTIRTEDIYVQGETRRPGFEIRADIQPGDSGGPVIVDGEVIAVLWARVKRVPGLAYAIDAERATARIDLQLESGELGDVDLTRCR